MTSATLPSGTGIVSTYSYDNADRLTGISHVRGGSTAVASVSDTTTSATAPSAWRIGYVKITVKDIRKWVR